MIIFNSLKMRHPGKPNRLIRDLVMISFIFVPVSALADDCSSLDTISWLTGQWVSVSEKSVTSESWQPLSDSSWEGSGETRDKTSGELRSAESLRLVAMSGEVFFIAKVDHKQYPVAFTLTECGTSGAVFENPDHDFPKKIEYLLQSSGDIHVQVSDGAEKGFEIRFQKTR